MTNELNDHSTAELLKQRLAEQDDLKKRFEAARPTESYKDEIDLGEAYRQVTEFRMDKTAFLIKHTPTEIINQWSAMTGPRSLKNSVEKWVDEIQAALGRKPAGRK